MFLRDNTLGNTNIKSGQKCKNTNAKFVDYNVIRILRNIIKHIVLQKLEMQTREIGATKINYDP